MIEESERLIIRSAGKTLPAEIPIGYGIPGFFAID